MSGTCPLSHDGSLCNLHCELYDSDRNTCIINSIAWLFSLLIKRL